MRNIMISLPATLAASAVWGAESVEEKIKRAQSAARSEISKETTVVDADGTVLKNGSNGWTCMPGTESGDKHPMCNDASWTKMMSAASKEADFKTDRIGTS